MFLDLLASAFRPLPYKPVRLDHSVTIGMAAHGGAEITNAALEHLFASTRGDYQLILVDDASQDDTLRVFKEARQHHRNLKIFSFPDNLEYCESVNAILSHAAGSFVFFISNDIFVTPAYFRELIACLSDNSGWGIARGCSNFVDAHTQPHNLLNRHYKFENEIELFAFAEALSEINKKRIPTEDPFLTGDAFAVSRRTIDRIGGFDTTFVGYFGDVDYGIRSRSAGLLPMVSLRAFAYHNSYSNMTYLDVTERDRKLQRRYRRVRTAYQAFLKKYSIADSGSTGEPGALDIGDFVNAVVQAKLNADRLQLATHVPLKNYDKYLVR